MIFNDELNDNKDEIKNNENEKGLNDFAKNLKAELAFENTENKIGNESDNNGDKSTINYACPERVLDYLQDKPYKILDFLLLASQKASKDEIKEIYDLFPITESDCKLSRPIIKKAIEDFISDKPELAKFFTEENLFYLRLVTRELEVHNALKLIRERKKVESGN